MNTDETGPQVSVDPRSTAVRDGYVLVSIDRFVAWANPSIEYSKLNVGPTCSPVGGLLIKIPVPDAVAGEPLTPEQFAHVMEITAKMVEPAVTSFARLVENNFDLPDADAWS